MQRRAAERRQRILEAGTALLLEGGTTAVTHRAVGERAAVPHASVRYYFATREVLLLACLRAVEAERDAEAQRAVLEAQREGAAARAGVTADRLLRCYSGAAVDDASLRAGVRWLVDTANESDELGEELACERVRIEAQARSVLEAGGRSGRAGHLAVTVVEGTIVNMVVQRRENIREEVTNALVELVLDHPGPPR
jgi:DNA-binding transcriptional regulator YbjK